MALNKISEASQQGDGDITALKESDGENNETVFERYTQEMECSETVRKEIMLGKRVGLYRIKGNLGNGNFSQVKLAVHLLTREEVAIKILDKTKLDAKTQRLLSREISSMERLHHPNVIRLYEVIEDFHKLHIVMEYASGGELHSMIINQGKIPEPIAKLIFSQVVAAIDHLHCQKVIHRDLKAENIFFAGDKAERQRRLSLTNDEATNEASSSDSKSPESSDSTKNSLELTRFFHVKLGDFGFSTMAEPMDKLTTFCGSPPYAAPELFQAEWYHGSSVDIWALGILLYFMVCGCMPFRGESVSALKKLILAGHYSCPGWMPPVAKTLIQNLLKQEPKNRLTIDQIKSHAWMNGEKFPSAFEPFKPTPSIPQIETWSMQKEILEEAEEGEGEDEEPNKVVDSGLSMSPKKETTSPSSLPKDKILINNITSPITMTDETMGNERDDIEAAKMLLRLGITDKHIEVAQAQAVRNYVTGTYRIMLHRVHKNRRMSHIPHSLSNPELGRRYLNNRRNHHGNQMHHNILAAVSNSKGGSNGKNKGAVRRSKALTKSDQVNKTGYNNQTSKMCYLL